MDREQMIAWLTLEGWSYWWQSADPDGLMEVDGVQKNDLYLGWHEDRYAVFQARSANGSVPRPLDRLMTADLAVMVAYIQEHNL